MPDLSIRVDGAEVVPFAIAPTIAFRLHVANTPADEQIHTVVLRCQLQLDVTRRQYSEPEQEQLRDLFGEPARWSQTLRSMLWTHATAIVPAFTGSQDISLLVPCTFDFNVAATKFFHALADGHVPVSFLFSGSVFYEDAVQGRAQVAPISWEKEAHFRLPVSTWQLLMGTYYPNAAWLTLGRDAFERLYRYKVREGIPTWEQVIETILPSDVHV